MKINKTEINNSTYFISELGYLLGSDNMIRIINVFTFLDGNITKRRQIESLARI